MAYSIPFRRSMQAGFWCAAILIGSGWSLLQGQQIQFVEEFVLSADRSKSLETLVPGTEDYFYYHALDQQLRQQYGPVDEWLKQWIEKYGITDRVKEMQLRQAILRYPNQPRASLDFIVQALGLRFDHQRRIPPAEQKLPVRLDPQTLAGDRLLERALRENPETAGVEQAGLELLTQKFE
ncbi:MAG: hypothetical protein ACKO9H_06515, partial [Planctomycetota bacterium]